jgi:hypothetical protein
MNQYFGKYSADKANAIKEWLVDFSLTDTFVNGGEKI